MRTNAATPASVQHLVRSMVPRFTVRGSRFTTHDSEAVAARLGRGAAGAPPPPAGPRAGVPGEPRPTAAFPIVGLGASAGGLAAFEAFFSSMPPGAEPGMAFVLVQHLAPDHKSILSDLLTRHTTMPVLEVEDGMPLAVN